MDEKEIDDILKNSKLEVLKDAHSNLAQDFASYCNNSKSLDIKEALTFTLLKSFELSTQYTDLVIRKILNH